MPKARFKIKNINKDSTIEKDFTGSSAKQDGFKWAHDYIENHLPKGSPDSGTGDQCPFSTSWEDISEE